MKLSIVIPAFNEEKYLGPCLESVHRAIEARAMHEHVAEVIVTDNNSSDATAEVARRHGVKVIFEPKRQIGGARNAGAAHATGDWILFIDADSLLHPDSLGALFACARRGRMVGGGSVVAMDGGRWTAKPVVGVWNLISRFFLLAAGSFLFCRRDAFEDVGGFSPSYYAGEELDLSRRLKAWGRARGLRFVILTRPAHVSSGRKFDLYSRGEVIGYLLRWARSPLRSMQSRDGLDFYYEGRR